MRGHRAVASHPRLEPKIDREREWKRVKTRGLEGGCEVVSRGVGGMREKEASLVPGLEGGVGGGGGSL